jgi:hypothetical protein
MTFQEGLHSVVAGADLRWLRGCSTVQKIRLLSSTGESDRAQALRDALADALPAVEVVVREQAEEEDGNYHGGSSGDDSSDGDSSGADSSESDTSDSEWQQRHRG